MTKFLFYLYFPIFIIACSSPIKPYEKRVNPYYYSQPTSENNFVYIRDTIKKNRIEFAHIFNSEIVKEFPQINDMGKFDKDSFVIKINDVILKMPNQTDIPDLIPTEIGILTHNSCDYLYIAEEYFSFINIYGWSYIFIKLSHNGYELLGAKQFSVKPNDLARVINGL